MKKAERIAVAGATGMVGEVMLQVLSERNFPFTELILVASERSVGKKIVFGSNSIAIYALSQMMTYFAYGFPLFNTSLNGIIYGGMVSLGIYPEIASLSWAILYTAFCYNVASYLYKRKIYLRL